MPNWNQVLFEVQQWSSKHTPLDDVRRTYLLKLHRRTKRNVIVYYSGWLSKPGLLQSLIDDEDKNGFMMAVHQLDRTKGLDLLLHTPGGNLAATRSLIHYLRQMFGTDIRVIVPQIAMSAGTIIACCAKTIVMGKHSNLGPIDPQIAGVPAKGVIDEFKKAYKEIKADPNKLALWKPILSQYRPTFLQQCQDASDLAEQFVREQLTNVMLNGDPDVDAKVDKILNTLTDHRIGHDNHYESDKCLEMGLKVESLESDKKLQDLVLTVHHCLMHTLQNSTTYKIIENHKGVAYMKQQRKVAATQ